MIRKGSAADVPFMRSMLAHAYAWRVNAFEADIPLSRYVEVFLGDEYLGRYLVDDTGGNVLGATLDIWNPDCKEAARFGRHWGRATLVAREVEEARNDSLVPTRWDGLAKR